LFFKLTRDLISVTYRTRDGTSEDQETSRFSLLSIKHAHKAIPILPVFPDSPPDSLSILRQSDLGNPDFLDDQCVDQLQSLSGPWNLRYSIPLRDEEGLHFTYDRRPQSVIEVEHSLRISLAVAALDNPSHHRNIELVFPVEILSVGQSFQAN
jgi:hypothetical protein